MREIFVRDAAVYRSCFISRRGDHARGSKVAISFRDPVAFVDFKEGNKIRLSMSRDVVNFIVKVLIKTSLILAKKKISLINLILRVLIKLTKFATAIFIESELIGDRSRNVIIIDHTCGRLLSSIFFHSLGDKLYHLSMLAFVTVDNIRSANIFPSALLPPV